MILPIAYIHSCQFFSSSFKCGNGSRMTSLFWHTSAYILLNLGIRTVHYLFLINAIWNIFKPYTLYCISLGRCCFWLKTRVIIEISKNPSKNPVNVAWFSFDWSKKNYFFWKKKYKMAVSKKQCFSKSPILNIFCENFMDRFLGW